MKLFATTATLVTFAAAAFAGPTQLELNIGIDEADYGKYSLAELVQIKSEMESENFE